MTCSRCHRHMFRRGLCQTHYKRALWLRVGDPDGPILTVTPRTGCQIDGCDGAHRSRGWCGAHYQRWLTYGDPLHIPDGRRRECLTCVETEWLLGSGGPLTDVWARQGYAPDASGRKALRQHLIRHGRRDLADRLADRREATCVR